MNDLPWMALGVLAALTVSVSHLLAVLALRRLSLAGFLATRSLAALVFTLPWLVHFDASGLDARGWLLFAASLFLSPFLISVFYFSGLSSGQMAVQNALRQVSPGLIILWQFLVLGIGVGLPGWIGFGSILAGAMLISTSSFVQASPAAVGFGLGAAAAHAAAMLVQTELLPILDARALIASQNLVFALLAGGWCLGKRRVASAASPRIPWLALLLALASGLLVQVLFDRLKFAILPEIGAFKTACLILLQLPFTAGLAGWILGESMDWRQRLAVACIFAGALLGSA